MADPYGLFDSSSGGVMGDMGGMRSGSYSPVHQSIMGSGGGMLGLADPSLMGGMMPTQGPPQQHPSPQTMNAYTHQGMQMHHQGVGPKLQHYGQYGGDYGVPPSRLHHLGSDPTMRAQQQGGLPPHQQQQMASTNSVLTPMMQQPAQQPQYPPMHRPPVNPSQHPMYSMHNSSVNNQAQSLHQPHPQQQQQQQQQTHPPMQVNQGMIWGGQHQYQPHSQQQHRPQHTVAYAQRHDYGAGGIDPGGPPQRLAHYSDAGIEQQTGTVPHIPHQVPGSKMGPVGVEQSSPSYPSVTGYHGGPDQTQAQRPPQHGYYGDLGHQGQPTVPKAPQYGTPYGPNGAIPSQPYQVQQQSQQQQHCSSGHQLVSMSSEPMGARAMYPQAPQPVPNGSPQYRPAYPQVNLSPRRPTPTPPVGSPMPPPSHTPERHILPAVSAAQAQGTYRTPSPSLSPSLGQSSLQQLEQMVMPHVGNRSSPLPPAPHSSPFHPSSVHHPQVSVAAPPPSHALATSPYSVGAPVEQRQHMTHHVAIPSVVSTSGGSSVPPPMTVGGLAAGLGSPGSHGPNAASAAPTNVVPQPSPHGRSVPNPSPDGHPLFEVQQLQQQLHQMYGMQQTPQTHQKIMELQEQLRVLQQQSQLPPASHHGQVASSIQTPPLNNESPKLPSTPQQSHPLTNQMPQMHTSPPQVSQGHHVLSTATAIMATQQVNMGHAYHHQAQITMVQPPVLVPPQHGPQMPQGAQQSQVPQPFTVSHEPNTHLQPQSHSARLSIPVDESEAPSLSMHVHGQMSPPENHNDLSMGMTFPESNPCDSLLGGLEAEMMMPFPSMQEDVPQVRNENQSQELCPKKPKKPKIPRAKKAKKSEKTNNINMDPSSSFLTDNAERSALLTLDGEYAFPGVDDEEAPKPKKKRAKKKKVPKESVDSNDLGDSAQQGEVKFPSAELSPDVQVKPKKPRTAKKPREPKPAKEKKPKKPREPKSPKETKSPKEPKPPKEPKEPKPPKEPKKPKETKEPKEKKVKSPKERDETKLKTPKIARRRPTKLHLSFAKKRKRGASSDISDVEKTPPPSPKEEDDGREKRRSARNTKRKKYTDDIDISITDDDDPLPLELEKQLPQPNEAGLIKPVQFFVNPNEEDAMLVERILSMRVTKPDPAEEGGGEPAEIEEFYVKYKNFSYLHCDWKTQEELEKGDKRVVMKIKRYKQKKQQSNNIFEFLEEEVFNPEYVEIDRVLDVSETVDMETKEQTKHFLVKWRGLAYDDSTWELEEDIEKEKIDQFIRFREPPPKDQLKPKKRPKPSDWQKLEDSRGYKHDNNLREYQLEGLNWLTFSWYNGQNCILADEMGLGKTIQSITFLYEVIVYGIRGPFLVIAPLSTITNWQREFETWSDMNVVVYHGSAASRNMIQEYEMYFKDEEGKRIPNIYKFNAMITTFEIIITDCLDLREIPWRCIIIDEAHRLKNKNCKLLEGLRLLNMEHRVLLSGTPLQNNVEELFSLLNFLEPTQFASSEEFLKEFGDLKSESQVQKLQQLLKPMMLRRLKEDVEKSLAPKEETIIEVELTNIQKKYYRAILERNFSFLAKGTAASNVPNLMNTMMELRKCCIHPYLINGAEEQIHVEYRSQHINDQGDDAYLQAMIHSSGKLVLIDKLLPKLRDSGHRVLVFSQMVRCLDILEDYLVHRRYPYERIDGRVRGNMRQAAIDRFSKPDSDRFVFLLCTRAGGLGINLTAADTVIIFDSDWNPQNDLQAQARCHRIGQQKAVKCYRLICRNTYEREMFDKASLKLGLDKAVLQSMNSAGKDGIQPQQLTKKEIEDLLRKGAYGALMDDDNAADQFCEEDIDQILQRRTQVIQLESGVKGSTFAKASFVASDNRSDIDIDDPEFWQKWAKKADVDLAALDGKNELIVTQPRRRIQTRRFGNEDQMLELTDLESSDDDDSILGNRRFGKKSRGSRKRKREEKLEEISDERPMASWGRAECFKVEKGLLTFGWGRWMELIATMKFKMRVENRHLEEISRIILLYCLRFYRGDDKIKTSVWELVIPITRNEHILLIGGPDCGGFISDGNPESHLGASGIPNSRSRKNKKSKKDLKLSPTANSAEVTDWTELPRYDPELWLFDENYKKHLQRHANRIVLRVRLLYYLKQEIIGDHAVRIAEGVHVSNLDMQPPWPDGDPPVRWWDEDADKSLLVGVYKHGYEKYNVMRLDPTLSFLAKCGPPDGAAVLAEINDNDGNDDDLDEKVQKLEEAEDEEVLSLPGSPKPDQFKRPDGTRLCDDMAEKDPSAFPSVSDLNTRLRRLITGYQRNSRKREQRLVQNAKKIERQEKFQAAVRERELRKRELQQRKWSRREEADFYRVVSAFGVEFLPKEGRYDWMRFRNMARLEKKYDETVTEYFKGFYSMCRKVCGKKLSEDEENLPIIVEPITEERARRCLERIDLLNKIREEVLPHPELEERLNLCKPSMDLPDWWICGKHDKELLIAAAKFGLGRMDYHLMHDPELSFHSILKYGPQVKEPSNINQSSSQSSPAPAEKTENAADGDKDFEVEGKPIDGLIDKKPGEELLEILNKDKVADADIKTELGIENLDVKRETEMNHTEDADVKSDDQVSEEKNGIESYVKVESLIKEGKLKDVLKEEREESKENLADVWHRSGPADATNDRDTDMVHVPDDCIKVKAGTHYDELEQTKEHLKNDEKVERKLLHSGEKMTHSSSPEKEGSESEVTAVEEESAVDDRRTASPDNKDDFVEPEQQKEIAWCQVTCLENEEKLATVSLAKEEELVNEASGPTKEVKEEKSAATCTSVIKQEQDLSEKFVLPKDSSAMIKDEDCAHLAASISDVFYPHPIYGFDLMDSSDLTPHLLLNSYHTSIRWPKDRVLQMRLEAVVQCIEKNEWPVIRFTQMYPLQGLSQSGTPGSVDLDSTPQVTPEHTPKRESTPWNTPTHPSEKDGSDSNNPLDTVSSSILLPPRRRRRRRRIEIETERAKLQALLSQNLYNTTLKMKFPMSQETPAQEPSSVSVTPEKKTPTVAPPPAHQHSAPRVSTPIVGSWDFTRKVEKQEEESPAPMDLSSSLKGAGYFESIDRSPLDSFLSPSGANKGPSDGLVMDLQIRRQEKKLRLEEQLAKIRSQKTGDFPATNNMKDDSNRLKKRRKLDEIVGSLTASAAPVSTHSSAEKMAPSITSISSESILKKLPPTPQQQLENEIRNSHLLHLASKRLEVEKWLADHSLQTMARRAESQMKPLRMDPVDRLDGRRGRRQRLDPNKLIGEHLTGNENVSVVNRLTGKKGNLPEDLKKRMCFPTARRGRRPGSSAANSVLSPRTMSMPSAAPLPSSYSSLPNLGALSSLASANMLAGFPGLKLPGLSEASRGGAGTSSAPMFLPFGGLAGLGLTNPLFANLASLSFAGFPFASSLSGLTPDPKSGKDATGNISKCVAASSASNVPCSSAASTTTTAPSLPLLFPAPGLLYNPLGLGNFSIPTSVPSSFASLTQAGLVNGLYTTRSGNFGTVTTPSILAGGIGNFAPGANGLIPAEDSDEDSLRSLMGNNYDDDDSTATEDELGTKKDFGVRRKEPETKVPLVLDSKSLGRLPGHSRSSTRSSSRTGPGRSLRHRVVDRPSRSELLMAEKLDARAIEKAMVERSETMAIERSLRAERRSHKKRHSGESEDSRLRKFTETLVGPVLQSDSTRDLERIVGSSISLLGYPEIAKNAMIKSKEPASSRSVILREVPLKVGGIDDPKRSAHSLVMENRSSWTRDETVVAVDSEKIRRTSDETKEKTKSLKLNQSGERIRLLSEKLKEKLRRSESDTPEVSCVVVEKSDEAGHPSHDSSVMAEIADSDAGEGNTDKS